MQISDEDLIAYLLGDAPPELSERMEREIASSPGLRERLSHLRMVLGQMETLRHFYEPPADLVDSTMARIDTLQTAGSGEKPVPAGDSSALLGALNHPSNPRSLWDSTALTLCLTVMCCLALPALVRARFESRKFQCASNLRSTGNSLFHYALADSRGRFPAVPLQGPESFAGVYAVRLRDSGNLLSTSQLNCPSLIGYEEAVPIQLHSIPTLAELHQLALQELEVLQRVIGGNYAYNLGVVEQGKVEAPQYEGRSHFAILADAPVIVNSRDSFVAHDGRGINILFEDGRIVFTTAVHFGQIEPLCQVGDNPFRNWRGVHEVGLHEQDASLAPSHFAPMGN